jgi:hypothetical protein
MRVFVNRNPDVLGEMIFESISAEHPGVSCVTELLQRLRIFSDIHLVFDEGAKLCDRFGTQFQDPRTAINDILLLGGICSMVTNDINFHLARWTNTLRLRVTTPNISAQVRGIIPTEREMTFNSMISAIKLGAENYDFYDETQRPNNESFALRTEIGSPNPRQTGNRERLRGSRGRNHGRGPQRVFTQNRSSPTGTSPPRSGPPPQREDRNADNRRVARTHDDRRPGSPQHQGNSRSNDNRRQGSPRSNNDESGRQRSPRSHDNPRHCPVHIHSRAELI